MISHLSAPAICVIDDEKADYEPILRALLDLHLAHTHVRGDTKASLPSEPFEELRLVFLDLHLSGQIGKDAASHTANVFAKVVTAKTAPVIVVIWSKYRRDVPTDGADGVPESQLFQQTLLEAFPDYKERLVFVEMAKPKIKDRPSAKQWVKDLKHNIQLTLEKLEPFNVLWAWESLVRKAGMAVTEGLTSLAVASAGLSNDQKVSKRLETILRYLVRAQGGRGCSAVSAWRHLASVLSQSIVDHLDHVGEHSGLRRYGALLSEQAGLAEASPFAAEMNGLLMTAPPMLGAVPFAPGTVYRVPPSKTKQVFGVALDRLVSECCQYSGESPERTAWMNANTPEAILLEVSPACDVHQQKRHFALLIGGLVFPASAAKKLKKADGVERLEPLKLRWAAGAVSVGDVLMVVLAQFKSMMPAKKEPPWLRQWFRLRELPTARLRNWHASHAARVGYVTL